MVGKIPSVIDRCRHSTQGMQKRNRAMVPRDGQPSPFSWDLYGWGGIGPRLLKSGLLLQEHGILAAFVNDVPDDAVRLQDAAVVRGDRVAGPRGFVLGLQCGDHLRFTDFNLGNRLGDAGRQRNESLRYLNPRNEEPEKTSIQKINVWYGFRSFKNLKNKRLHRSRDTSRKDSIFPRKKKRHVEKPSIIYLLFSDSDLHNHECERRLLSRP